MNTPSKIFAGKSSRNFAAVTHNALQTPAHPEDSVLNSCKATRVPADLFQCSLCCGWYSKQGLATPPLFTWGGQKWGRATMALYSQHTQVPRLKLAQLRACAHVTHMSCSPSHCCTRKRQASSAFNTQRSPMHSYLMQHLLVPPQIPCDPIPS